MIGFMSVEAQAEMDFDRARRRAFFRRVAARLRRECNRLLAFDETREGHLAHNRRRLGLRDVEVSKIVGTVGRPEAFDRGFMPARKSLAERWKRVDRAFHRELDLPAVRLYKMLHADVPSTIDPFLESDPKPLTFDKAFPQASLPGAIRWSTGI
jgi:hypothetical protein